LPGQIEALRPLLSRTRDLRLLVMRARLVGLNRDLASFAITVAAIAEWLDKFWDGVHPRVAGDDLAPRVAALAALDLPTVIFPLQYAPLFETRRLGVVSYRALMVATGEVKPRPGEEKHAAADLTQAVADADPEKLAPMRQHVALLKSALVRIRQAFALHGGSSGLESVPALVDKISAFLDPRAAALDGQSSDAQADDAEAATNGGATPRPGGAAPTSLAQAKHALAAVADYYSRLEPSSPTLPLVRQAHDLIGKSFFEVMSILVPTQIENAAFQIGAEQIFELPVGRLPNETGDPSAWEYPSQNAGFGEPADGPQPADAEAPRYSVRTGSSVLSRCRAFQPGADAV
jgi:type VI secretion system protein ImpA